MNKPTKTILILIVILIAGSLGYVFWSSRSTSNGQNITNQPLTQPEQQKNQEPDSQGVEVITPDVDTSDWVEYTNTALGYKVKLPPKFKVYSEFDGSELTLSAESRSIFLKNKDNTSTINIASSSIGGRTIDEFFDFYRNKYNTEFVKIGNNFFIYETVSSTFERFFVSTGKALVVINISSNTKEQLDVLRNGILSTFELIE